MSAKKTKMRWFRIVRWLCCIFCKLFFKIKIYNSQNIPKDGGFLLICNHQSLLDPILCGIGLERPLYFLAKHTLFKNKFFGWLISSVNTIPVRRGESDITAMKTIIRKLKEGNGVCLFPEGTRTHDGKISKLKPGFGLICRRGGAAIVPAIIDGAFECWPRHKKIFTRGSEIAIQYGKCMTAEEVKALSDKELAQNITNTLRQLQNDCRIKHGKNALEYKNSEA